MTCQWTAKWFFIFVTITNVECKVGRNKCWSNLFPSQPRTTQPTPHDSHLLFEATVQHLIRLIQDQHLDLGAVRKFLGHVGTKGTRSQMSMHDMSNTVDICRYLYGMCMCVCVRICLYMLYCCTGKIVFACLFVNLVGKKWRHDEPVLYESKSHTSPRSQSCLLPKGMVKDVCLMQDVHPQPVPQMLQMNLAKSSSNSREEESPIPMDPKKQTLRPCG